MGGGLGFLNKKTWHPGRLSNIENVWKKEQEHAKEQNKLEDLRKQIADERQKEELETIAAAAGHKVRSDRLDWMYSGGMLAKQEADQRTEEAMMTGKPIQQEESTELNRAQQAVLLPTFYSEDTPASANETWARLHSDPLFAIRQQEQTARKAIVANPVKMDHIKAEVEKLKQSSALNKAAKKAEKKASKEAKKGKKRAADQMQAALAAKGVGPPASSAQAPYRTHTDSDHRSRRGDLDPRDMHESSARPDQSYLRNSRATEDDSLPDYREDGNRMHKHRRLHSPQHTREADHHRHRGSDHQRDQSDRRYSRAQDSRHHKGSVAAHDSHGRHDSDAVNGHDSRHALNGHGERRTAQADSRGDNKYGLSWGETAPEELQARDRQEAAAATRKRLDDAADLKAREEREKAAQRHQRQEYKTGKLSQEEKARRLAEMQGNAEVHDDARWKRLSDEKEKDAAEAVTLANQGTGSAAAFLKQAHKTIYGATGEGASLEDRVGRRKFYNDKDTERGAFKRQH